MAKQATKVLVVEDEMFIALDLSATLQEAGFDVMGPFHDSHSALDAINMSPPDAALLDVNLGRFGTSDAIADLMASKGRPFAFITGYKATGASTLERYPAAPCLSKPVEMAQVIDWLSRI